MVLLQDVAMKRLRSNAWRTANTSQSTEISSSPARPEVEKHIWACAFGMEACKQYYTVQYVRLPDMLLDLQAARDNGNFPAVLKKYTKPILLIIDEWLLLKLTEPEARNLFELIHKRRKKSSTIFCSKFREEEWYQQICGGESMLTDSIMDRISYDSYKIDIESADPSKDISMRETYGLNPEKAR